MTASATSCFDAAFNNDILKSFYEERVASLGIVDTIIAVVENR